MVPLDLSEATMFCPPAVQHPRACFFRSDPAPAHRAQTPICMMKPLAPLGRGLQSVDTVVVEELLLRLKSTAYMTGDIIIRKGDPGDWMGFVSHGMIAVLDPNYEATDVVQRLLRVGSHFGEISLLHNQARASSLQALTWTQLEVVTQKSWREIEKLRPEEMRLCRSEIHRMLAERQQVA